MKYLYLKSADSNRVKMDKIVPVDGDLSIQWFQGKPYLACGDRLLIDVDKHNETALLPFLADAFNHCDVATINLTNGAPAVTPKIRENWRNNSENPFDF